MEDIDSVGMGTPGTVNQDGVIEFANNLAFNNVPARTMLAKELISLRKRYLLKMTLTAQH